MQGFGKGLKEIRDRFDTIMERAIKEHEEERKNKGKTRSKSIWITYSATHFLALIQLKQGIIRKHVQTAILSNLTAKHKLSTRVIFDS